MNDNRVLLVQSPTRLQSLTPQRVSVTEEGPGNGRFDWDESAEAQSIKFVIMNCTTAEFIRCDSQWTLEFKEALDFLSVQSAICWGVKELKTSFEVVKIQMNRVLASIKIVIPPLLWSKTSGTSYPDTVLEFRERVLLAAATQSAVGSVKPIDLVARMVLLAGERWRSRA
jgi:hypothetical protein